MTWSAARRTLLVFTTFQSAARTIAFVAVVAAVLCAGSRAHGQANSPLYWNTTTTADWSSTANWWTPPSGTANPSAVPGATNDAVFNGTGVNGAETVTLSGPQAAMGLYFSNTGTTLLDSVSPPQTLSIGTDGITLNSGAGAVTIGDPTDTLNLSLAGAQSWTNSSSSLLLVVNGVNNSGNLLTFAGGGSGGFVVQGAVSGAGGLTMNSSGTLTLSGSNTYGGTTTVSAGTLLLDFSQAGAPASKIINNSAVSSALTMSGGTLTVKGASGGTILQQFNGLSLGSGGSSIIANSNGASSYTLSLGGTGTLTHTVGATLNFTLPTTGSITTGYSNDANGLLGAGVTVGGTDWATVSGGNVIALPSGSYTTDNNVSNWAANDANKNVNVSGTVTSSSKLGASVTLNSLRVNAKPTNAIALNSKTLTLLDGLLITNSVGGNQVTISGGNLEGSGTSGSRDLVVINNDTTSGANLTISATIVDNGGATGLTYQGVANNANNNTFINTAGSFTGNVTINGGNLVVNTGNSGNNSALGNVTTSGKTVTVNNGGTLTFNAGNALVGGNGNPALAMVVNQGGTANMNTNGNNAIGALTLNGGTITGIPSTNNWQAWNLNGGSVTSGGSSFSTMTTTNQSGTGAGFSMAATTTFTVAPVPIESNGADLVVSAPLGDQDPSFSGNTTPLLPANMIKAGVGVMALNSGYSSFTGSLTINAGAISSNASFQGATGTTGTAAWTTPFGEAGVKYGSGGANARTLTVGSTASMIWTSNNTLAGAGVNAAVLPTITLNGGTLKATQYNAIGNINLNSGAVLTQSATISGNNYQGFQLLGSVTVAGTSASTMSGTGNAGDQLLSTGTTFNVGSTGDSGGDLLVTTPLVNDSGDYGNNSASSLVKTGVGVMVLSAANTYTGGTTINVGTLRLSGAGTLGATSGALTLGGGTLDLNGTSQAVGNFTGTSGTVLNSAGSTTATLTIGSGNGTGGSFAGLIEDNAGTGGTVAITKTGTGTIALTNGGNAYSGGTTIGGGTLRFVNGALGSGNIAFTGGTLQYAGGANQDISGRIFNSSGPVNIDLNGQSVSFGTAIDGSNGLGLAISSSTTGGVLTLNAANTYTGPTAVNSGTLVLGSTGSLGNTAITVASGAMFSVRPGSGTATIGSTSPVGAGASLTLNPGSVFDMADGAIGTVNLQQEATFGPGLILGGAAGTAPTLTFEIDGSGHNDSLNVSNAVTFGATGATLFLSPLSGTGSLQLGNYTVLTAASGLGSGFSIQPLITVNGHPYSLSLANSTSTSEVITIGNGNTFPTAAYWNGGLSTNWNTLSGANSNTNWSTDSSGATDTFQVPGPATNVFFTVNGGGSNLATTLGQSFAVNSLNFTADAASPVSISGNTLTINAANGYGANPAGTGIVVAANSAAHTIASNVVLGGNQTWTNNSTSALSVSGNIGDGGGNYNLNTAGIGTIVLSGANSVGGALTVGSGGTLRITGTTAATGGVIVNGTLDFNSTTAIGSSALTLNGGAVIDNTTSAGIINANVNSITWAGDFSYGGTQALNLGTGAVSATQPTHTIALSGPSTSSLTFGGTLTNTSGGAQTLTVNGPGETLTLGGYALTNGATNVTDIINGSGSVIFSGPVINGGTSTASSLTYSGIGTLRINAASTYAGATNVNSGILILGAGGQNGTLQNSAITVALGAELQTSGQDDTGWGVTQPLTIYGTLRKLAGNFHESLARPTLLSGGTITSNDTAAGQYFNQFGSTVSTALNSGNSYITLTSGGQWQLRVNGATNASFDVASGSTLNINATLADFDAAGDPLIFNDTGTMVLLGANTYSGGTTIAAGTLQLGDGATNTGVIPGAALDNGTIVFNNPGTQTYGGAISGSGTVSKIGSGTEVLAGNSGYGGGTTVSNGTLAVQTNTALGTNTVTLAGGRLQLQGAPAGNSIGVHFGTDQGSQFNLTSAQSAGASGFAMTNWNNAPGNNTNTLSVTSPAAGQLVDNHGNVQNTTIAWARGGTFKFGNTLGSSPDDALMGSFTNNNGTTTFTVGSIPYADYSVVAYLGCEGGANNGRTASINIGGTTYYYATDTNAGANPFNYVQITNTSSASHPAGNYAVFTGLTGNSFTATLSTGSNSGVMGLEIVNTTPALSLSNAVTLTADSTIDVTGNNSAAITGLLSIGSNTLNVTGGSTGANAAYALTLGAVNLSGNPTFNVANNGSGAGTLNLGAINDAGTAQTMTFSGVGTVNLAATATSLSTNTIVNVNAGTLRVGAASALGSTAQVSVASPALFNVAANQTISSLAGAGTVSLGSGATLTVGSSDNLSSASFTGTIGGQGALAVGGTGTLTLSTGNSYSGGTTVGSGTLRLTYGFGTATGSGNITLNGGTLVSGALGIASGNIVAGAGPHAIAPGGIGSFGALNVGGVTLNSNSTLDFDLGTPVSGGSYGGDLISLGAAGLTVTGNPVLNLSSNPMATGDYRLFSGSLAGGSLGSISFAQAPPGNLSYTLQANPASDPGYIDLVVATAGAPIGSGTWTNGAGDYKWTTDNNWQTGQPIGAGLSATFDATGQSATTSAVLLNGPETIGVLVLNTASGGYTIGTGASDGTLTLDNTGGVGPAAITVNAGSHTVAAPINNPNGVTVTTAADLSPSSLSLTLSGSINGNGGLTKAGAGTLRLSATNGYLGGTTVSAGKLRTAADGALGSGPLAIGNAAVTLGGSENVSSLSMSSASGSLSVAAAKTLTVTQSGGDTSAAGTITLAAGAGMSPGGALNKAGGSTLEIDATPSLLQNSSLAVNYTGTLRINVGSGTPNAGTVGTGVSVAIGASATLELDGTTSTLMDSTVGVQRASIANSGNLNVGTSVANTVQQVGGIDGAGSVTVADTASLTADHINQTALAIGNGSTFTLAASDPNGNPMAQSGIGAQSGSSLVLAGSLSPSSAFAPATGNLLGVGAAIGSASSVTLGGAVASVAAVPEPSTLLLAGLALLGLAACRRRNARRSA